MAYKREDINGTTPLDLKKLNDNVRNIWYKVFGDIDFGDLNKATQKTINSKVSEGAFTSYQEQTAQQISSKVSNGDFDTYKTQTATEIANKVSNTTYNSYVSQTADTISQKVAKGTEFSTEFNQNAQSFTFTIGNGTTIVMDKDHIRISHADGSYTEMNTDGFKRHIGATSKEYHYLLATGSSTTLGTWSDLVWVQLPDEFKNKNFNVTVSLKSTRFNVTLDYYLADIYVAVYSVDTVNGKFSVVGMARYVNVANSSIFYDYGIDFSYTVTA